MKIFQVPICRILEFLVTQCRNLFWRRKRNLIKKLKTLNKLRKIALKLFFQVFLGS